MTDEELVVLSAGSDQRFALSEVVGVRLDVRGVCKLRFGDGRTLSIHRLPGEVSTLSRGVSPRAYGEFVRLLHAHLAQAAPQAKYVRGTHLEPFFFVVTFVAASGGLFLMSGAARLAYGFVSFALLIAALLAFPKGAKQYDPSNVPDRYLR